MSTPPLMHACGCIYPTLGPLPMLRTLCGAFTTERTHERSKITCPACHVQLDVLDTAAMLHTWPVPGIRPIRYMVSRFPMPRATRNFDLLERLPEDVVFEAELVGPRVRGAFPGLTTDALELELRRSCGKTFRRGIGDGEYVLREMREGSFIVLPFPGACGFIPRLP